MASSSSAMWSSTVTSAPVPGVGCATTIDVRGKRAVRSTAAWEEDTSLSWVTRRFGDGGATGAAVAAVAMAVTIFAVLMAAAASTSARVVVVGDASPVEAIAVHHHRMVAGSVG